MNNNSIEFDFYIRLLLNRSTNMNNNWPRLSVDGIECQKPPKTGGLYLFTFKKQEWLNLEPQLTSTID